MYKLDFSPEGKISLAALDKKTGQRILDKLKWLVKYANSINHLSLKGEFSGLFKLRTGDWRIIYEFNEDKETITVHKIGHRKEIYK